MAEISSIRLPDFTRSNAPEIDGGPERAPTPKPPESQDSTVGDRITISERARALVAEALQARREASPQPPQTRELPAGVEFSRGGGSVNISREVETAAGGTRTRELSVSVDPQAQSITRERSVTGSNGQTIALTGNLERTENGFVGSLTVTGPDGGEITRTVSQTFDDEAGTFSRSVVLSGGTYDISRSTELSRSTTGITAAFELDVQRNDAPESQGGPDVEA